MENAIVTILCILTHSEYDQAHSLPRPASYERQLSSSSKPTVANRQPCVPDGVFVVIGEFLAIVSYGFIASLLPAAIRYNYRSPLSTELRLDFSNHPCQPFRHDLEWRSYKINEDEQILIWPLDQFGSTRLDFVEAKCHIEVGNLHFLRRHQQSTAASLPNSHSFAKRP